MLVVADCHASAWFPLDNEGICSLILGTIGGITLEEGTDVCKTRDIFLTLTLSNFQYPLCFFLHHYPTEARNQRDAVQYHCRAKGELHAPMGDRNYTDHNNYHCHAKGDWQSQMPW